MITSLFLHGLRIILHLLFRNAILYLLGLKYKRYLHFGPFTRPVPLTGLAPAIGNPGSLFVTRDREGSPRLLKDKTQLPSLHRDLLYSPPGAPSSAPYLNCASGNGNAFGPPFYEVNVQVLRSLVASRC